MDILKGVPKKQNAARQRRTQRRAATTTLVTKAQVRQMIASAIVLDEARVRFEDFTQALITIDNGGTASFPFVVVQGVGSSPNNRVNNTIRVTAIDLRYTVTAIFGAASGTVENTGSMFRTILVKWRNWDANATALTAASILDTTALGAGVGGNAQFNYDTFYAGHLFDVLYDETVVVSQAEGARSRHIVLPMKDLVVSYASLSTSGTFDTVLDNAIWLIQISDNIGSTAPNRTDVTSNMRMLFNAA